MKGAIEFFNTIPVKKKKKPFQNHYKTKGAKHWHNGEYLTIRDHCENEDVKCENVRSCMASNNLDLTAAIERTKENKNKTHKLTRREWNKPL